ncbi:bifunctional cytidylyltransferase/SDR family oxidoreductase [Actinoplanes sp. NPDC051851]|uniref:bifunctional cytidylyltransferase/SDR family oxidoreductase n=1 Tax=Actinoplanes sp. NPDC051851 TaxID=3154753 RepID=UPI00343F8279
MPTVAVILAGGVGERVGLQIPKQLVKIAGKPVIEHAIEVFEKSPVIDRIIILMTPGYIDQIQEIVARAGFTKVTTVIEGGRTRSETTRKAIAAVGDDECKMIIHDAVRPLVSQRIIADSARALDRYEAIDVAIPSADTVIAVERLEDGDEVITDIPDRSRLRRGQTPQGFRLSTLRKAYELAAADPGFTATDDCGVVRRYLPEVPIHVVVGDENNLKITHPIDIHLADKLFQLKSDPLPTEKTFAERHALLNGKTVVVFGGSYGIGKATGDLAREYGATVLSFSRSTTGTHVENPQQVTEALKQAHERTGRIDYVINTAGLLRIGKLAETDDTVIEEALRVNYLAPVYIARAAAPYLAETKGSLLLYTSSSYTRGRADYSLYSSTKAATVNLTQALADEWSEQEIRINCINPERTSTPMRWQAFGEEPPGSMLSAEAVAGASVDVMISEMTGHIVDVRRADSVISR